MWAPPSPPQGVLLADADSENDNLFLSFFLQESALADTVRRLGELEGVPLGDVYGLRVRARTLAERWREAFGGGVVDLQQGVLLRVS